MYILISLLFMSLIIIYVVQTFLYSDLLDELKHISIVLREIKLTNVINSDYTIRCLEELCDKANEVDIPEFMKDRKE